MTPYTFDDKKLHDQILESIPDKPRIPIKNFLLDLVCEEDCKERSIYLKGADPFIKEMWHEIIQKNWRRLNIRKFVPTKFNISYSAIYGYKSGRKNISIQTMYQLTKIWKELCNKSEKEFLRKWDEIFNKKLFLSTHSKYQKTSLPRYISPKLSYLLGWICGDGNLQHEDGHYVVKISEKSKEQLEVILKPLFREVFEVDPPIFLRYGRGYAIQIGSKSIYRFFTKVIKIKVGEIPSIIDDFDSINKKYFLIGLFDAEGYVDAKYLDSRVTITQSKKDFLEHVMMLFNEIGILFTGPHFHKNYLGYWYSIEVRKKMEILRYARYVGSCHVDKLKKLEQLVDVIEKNWSGKSTVASW
jgi:hypothetical protein